MRRLDTKIGRLIVPVNIIFLVIGLILLCLSIEVWAGEKEELSLEWRALVAEYNLAFERFQQVNPQYKALLEFQKKLEAKGLMFEKGTGKVIEKPKPSENKSEPPKK